MKDKKTLIQRIVFFPPPKNSLKKLKIPADTAYLSIIKENVYNTSVTQFIKKTLGPDKINFGILCIIWK